MANLQPYQGRLNDVMITTGYSGKLEFEISNKIVSGIQKAVQSFIIRLFTALDSYIFDDKTGTLFARELNNLLGGPNTGLVYHYISLSLSEVIGQLKQEPSSEPDENIINASVTNVTMTEDTTEIEIKVVTEAGEYYTFILPINIPIMN